VNRHDDRLRAWLAEEIPRIVAVLGKHGVRIAARERRRDGHQVESRREQSSVTEHHNRREDAAASPSRRYARETAWITSRFHRLFASGRFTPIRRIPPSSSTVTTLDGSLMVRAPDPLDVLNQAALGDPHCPSSRQIEGHGLHLFE
jgi:hypothetical protein